MLTFVFQKISGKYYFFTNSKI